VNLIYDPGANEDYYEGIEFYLNRDPGVAVRFVEEIEATEDRILKDPESYAFMAPELRSLRVPGFPYSIVYRYSPIEPEVFVVAVWHMSRHPRYFRNRLSPE